jgi:hypothetical protein
VIQIRLALAGSWPDRGCHLAGDLD